jgi:AraC-like DNA-binding protein
MHESWSYSKDLPLKVFRAVDLEFLAHWHTDVELAYVLSGSIAVSVNRERRVLGRGSFVACGSRDIHYYERTDERSETLLAVFKPSLAGRAPVWPALDRLSGHFAADGSALAETAGRVLLCVERELAERKPAYEGIARGGIMELCSLAQRELATFGRASASGRNGGKPGPTEPEASTLERMQLAIDFIYERYADPICLADVAEAASLSPWYFSRAFSATVGASFRSFLNGVRIERAEELMAEPDAKLADIALECGFESVRTFNRAFLALRGRPPSAARETRAPRIAAR